MHHAIVSMAAAANDAADVDDASPAAAAPVSASSAPGSISTCKVEYIYCIVITGNTAGLLYCFQELALEMIAQYSVGYYQSGKVRVYNCQLLPYL